MSGWPMSCWARRRPRYVRGLTTRAVRPHLREMYQVDVSPDPISPGSPTPWPTSWRTASPLDAAWPEGEADGMIGRTRSWLGSAGQHCRQAIPWSSHAQVDDGGVCAARRVDRMRKQSGVRARRQALLSSDVIMAPRGPFAAGADHWNPGRGNVPCRWCPWAGRSGMTIRHSLASRFPRPAPSAGATDSAGTVVARGGERIMLGGGVGPARHRPCMFGQSNAFYANSITRGWRFTKPTTSSHITG